MVNRQVAIFIALEEGGRIYRERLSEVRRTFVPNKVIYSLFNGIRIAGFGRERYGPRRNSIEFDKRIDP